MIRTGSSGSTSRQGETKRSLLFQRRAYLELLSFTFTPQETGLAKLLVDPGGYTALHLQPIPVFADRAWVCPASPSDDEEF